MGLKNELKHGLKNILHDVDLSVSKTWEVTYEGQRIRVVNSMDNEQLYINDELVDKVMHRSLLSHLKPYSTLTGTITRNDNITEKVFVKIGGFIKLSIEIKVGRHTLLKEKMSIEILPWEKKERIVPFIERQVCEHQTIVDSNLPDEKYLYNVGESTKPGYLDYVGYDAPLPFFKKSLVKQIKLLLKQPTLKRRRIIYKKVNDEYVAMYYPDLLSYLQAEDLDQKRLREEALWFLAHAAHREVVKFALVLLGLTDVERYKEKLLTLALHEEFTVYTLISVSQLDDAHPIMWELAQRLSGWGKIAVMKHLDAITQDEKMWFLEQQFSNPVMDEAVALLIARTAEFDVLLAEKDIEESVFMRINLVLYHLLSESHYGNRRAIDNYEYAPLVLTQYINRVKTSSRKPNIQATVGELNRYINEADDMWEERFDGQWKRHEHDAVKRELKYLDR